MKVFMVVFLAVLGLVGVGLALGWGWFVVCLVGLCFLGSPSPLLRAGKSIFTGVF
jgi:hypothetical protein